MVMRLNTVLALAPSFTARGLAPHSFGDIMSLQGDMIVWEGASANTVWGDERSNHAFRAWHDECHRLGAFPFTLQGERDTCKLQIRQVLERWPNVPEHVLATIRREVIGQAEYFEMFGEFPLDQLAFHARASSSAIIERHPQ